MTGGPDTGGTETGGAESGNPTPAVPSAGCGLSTGIPTAANVANTIVTFPAGYDGSTPMPLVFAFHGAGRTNEQMRTVDSRTAGSMLEANYIVAYVKSTDNAWVIGTDTPRFNAVYGDITNRFCVDTNRVFGTGHSSGAQFIVQLLCAGEERFRGIVPVASSVYCQSWASGPIPTLVIHGMNDNQRPGDGNGRLDIVPYLTSNGCDGINSTDPYDVGTCNSIANNTAVTPGCVSFQGCSTETFWCNHNDPNYIDNATPTNHGWPCFANGAIVDFFESLD